MFSSERGPIRKAYRPVVKKFGMYMRQLGVDLALTKMNDDSAWLIGAEPKGGTKSRSLESNWIEWHQKLSIASHFTGRTYNPHEAYHWMRKRWYDTTKANVVKCPNKKCQVWIPLTPEEVLGIANMHCTDCGTSLVAK